MEYILLQKLSKTYKHFKKYLMFQILLVNTIKFLESFIYREFKEA